MEAPHCFSCDGPERERMMGPMVGDADEFDEFDVTEEEFDRMLAASEPVTIDQVPKYHVQRVKAEGYYVLTTVRQSPPAAASRVRDWTLEPQPPQASAVSSVV